MKTELTINVRPLRHVYFIAENDLKRFTEVASFCCTQWGGINNLIIPLPIEEAKTKDLFLQKDSLFSQIIRRRNPDIFVDAVASIEGGETFYRSLMSWLTSAYPGWPVIKWESFLIADQSLHSLQIVIPQTNTLMPVLGVAGFFAHTKVSELDNAIRFAAFGKIWPGQERDYQAAYHQRWWPMELSEASLRAQVEDLCWFWNLRAYSFGNPWLADRRVLLLSKSQFLDESFFEPLERILKEHRDHPYIRSNLDVNFHYKKDAEILQYLQTRIGFQRHEGDIKYTMSDYTPEDFNGSASSEPDNRSSKPIIYTENVLPDLPIYHECSGNRPTFSLALTEEPETFLVPNAGPRSTGFGQVHVGLQSDFWNQFPGHSTVANLIIPSSSFNVFLNPVELNYQYTFPPQGIDRLSLKLPKMWEIYHTYFGFMGYDVSQSDKMFYANGLIGIAGGFEKAEILRSPVAHKILDALADKSTPKLARELREQLSQQGFSLPQSFEEYLQGVVTDIGAIPQFKRNPRTFTKIKEALLDRDDRVQCLKVLSELVRIKAVQRGLDIKCPHCQTTIWYGISDLDERMRCLGCLETFDLPLTENALDPIDRSFQYSLNPLANRAMDQDILPVITALLTLKTIHSPMFHLIPGMNFKEIRSTNNAGDFDFVYIYKHELYAGECKAGEMLSQKDINTARIAHQLGFRAFFFVTTKTFTEEAMELVHSYQQELANDKNMECPYTIVVLDKRTLFEGEPLPKEIPI